jgi:hypothetical protein
MFLILMDETAAVFRDASRNLREAEHTLRSIDANLRRNQADIAMIRAWISAATADFNAATASGDPSGRDHALQSLADAHDSLRDFERVGAKFAQLKLTAQSTADRVRQILRDAQIIAADTEKPGPANPETGQPTPDLGPAS